MTTVAHLIWLSHPQYLQALQQWLPFFSPCKHSFSNFTSCQPQMYLLSRLLLQIQTSHVLQTQLKCATHLSRTALGLPIILIWGVFLISLVQAVWTLQKPASWCPKMLNLYLSNSCWYQSSVVAMDLTSSRMLATRSREMIAFIQFQPMLSKT